jgi:hypothetical protein
MPEVNVRPCSYLISRSSDGNITVHDVTDSVEMTGDTPASISVAQLADREPVFWNGNDLVSALEKIRKAAAA